MHFARRALRQARGEREEGGEKADPLRQAQDRLRPGQDDIEVGEVGGGGVSFQIIEKMYGFV